MAAAGAGGEAGGEEFGDMAAIVRARGYYKNPCLAIPGLYFADLSKPKHFRLFPA